MQIIQTPLPYMCPDESACSGADRWIQALHVVTLTLFDHFYIKLADHPTFPDTTEGETLPKTTRMQSRCS